MRNILKRLKNYLQYIQDYRLRKWCVRQSAKCSDGFGYNPSVTTSMYEFIKEAGTTCKKNKMI